jgi:hypothetical protein
VILALSETETITLGVIGWFVLIGIFVLLRVLFRKEPSPPSWQRFRIGFFVERDPKEGDDD